MNSDSYKNLIELLKLFKNRPYHLAKYLADNNALDDRFIENLSNNDSLNKISKEESNPPVTFVSISQMEEFYLSLIDIKDINDKTKEEIEKEFNEKLDYLILSEKYEDAARIRDYMKRKNIKRINKI
jgi:hypothetical protein